MHLAQLFFVQGRLLDPQPLHTDLYLERDYIQPSMRARPIVRLM